MMRKKSVICISGIAAAAMLLAGCGRQDAKNRAAQEGAAETDAVLQLQQNGETEDLSEEMPQENFEQPEQSERSEEAGQQGQTEQPEQSGQTEQSEQPERSEPPTDIEADGLAQERLEEDRIIEEQSFQVTLNDWGEVRFLSYEPVFSEENPLEDVTFYLLKDEAVLYQFPYIGTEHTSDAGLYYDMKFVMFMDTNADEREDVVIGTEYMTGAGPQGAVPHTVVRIYEDCGDCFTYNESLSDAVNHFLPWESNVLARDVKRLIQLTNGGEPLTDYESYSGKWREGSGYIAAYENPEPVSKNELAVSISNGIEFSGSLYTEQGITERIASVEEISGTIQNGELFYEFTDDGWGGTGTLHITFLPNQINVEVLDYRMAEENASGYGISGNYEMTVRE